MDLALDDRVVGPVFHWVYHWSWPGATRFPNNFFLAQRPRRLSVLVTQHGTPVCLKMSILW